MTESPRTCPDDCDFPEWWARLTDEDMDAMDAEMSDPSARMDA